MKFLMGTCFEYVQTKLRVQTHSEVKLLNDRYFFLFGEGNTINVYVYIFFFQLILGIAGSFEIVLTAILWSSVVN